MTTVIKIIGVDCPNCQKVEEIARKAAESMGIEAEYIKLRKPNEWLKYNIITTPGLVINEKLVSSGRIPTIAEVSTWLADSLM